jgi:hypothetical protein
VAGHVFAVKAMHGHPCSINMFWTASGKVSLGKSVAASSVSQIPGSKSGKAEAS